MAFLSPVYFFMPPFSITDVIENMVKPYCFACHSKRVNFDKPELSPLLLKPSGSHHFGGMRAGFSVAGDRSSYDLFLNWILQGAREN